MLWALEHGVEADAFVILTDNETWYGKIHPYQALQKYRQTAGIPAKLAVVGMGTDTRTSSAASSATGRFKSPRSSGGLASRRGDRRRS